MDAQVLKVVGQVAGIGGLALGVFFLLFRDVLRKSIFPSLTKAQGYRIILLVLVLTFLLAALCIGGWLWLQAGPAEPKRPSTSSEGPSETLDGEYKLRLSGLAASGCYFFEWDRSTILSVPDFVEAAQGLFLEQHVVHGDAPVEVHGFAETGYTDDYALSVSLQRAETVRHLLLTQYHLPPGRIVTVGMGLAGNPPRVREFFCGAKLVIRER